MNKNPKLECEGLRKSFVVRGRTIEVLKGIDLEIFPGEMVVIKGRSGQGKSVLMWLLSGIDAPSAGQVKFEGAPYGGMDSVALARLRREKIGLVFQNFNLIPSWTALENVESAMLGSGIPLGERREKCASFLARMGMGDRLDNLPAELSAGQQQRVALARALINGPSLIVADEPTGNVDEETAAELLAILFSFVKEKNAAMVVATHGSFSGEGSADRLLWLRNGKLAAAG